MGRGLLTQANVDVVPVPSGSIRSTPRTHCTACGAPGTQLYDNLRDNLFSAPGVWSLKQCTNAVCGMLWLDPMPVVEDLYLAYEKYYTHGGPVHSASYNFNKRIYRFLIDLLLSVLAIPAERRRAQLMFVGDRKPGTLLDVGCGHGIFIADMARRGWKVAGVDFDPAAVQAARARDLDVQVGTVQDVIASGRSFDLVTASHVIEHVPEPVEFLTQCRQLLRPGGAVLLRTPNVDSLGHRSYRRAWRGLEPPRHLHLFTIRAIDACARKAGFGGAHCFTTSVGAEYILIASRFLSRKGSFRSGELSRKDLLEWSLLAPLLALWAKGAWLRNKNSGEELCAILTDGSSEPAH